jgi:hypothetical protein
LFPIQGFAEDGKDQILFPPQPILTDGYDEVHSAGGDPGL